MFVFLFLFKLMQTNSQKQPVLSSYFLIGISIKNKTKYLYYKVVFLISYLRSLPSSALGVCCLFPGLVSSLLHATENRCYLCNITSQSTHILSHVIFFDLLGLLLLHFSLLPLLRSNPPLPSSPCTCMYTLRLCLSLRSPLRAPSCLSEGQQRQIEQPDWFMVTVDVWNSAHLFSVSWGQKVHGGSDLLDSRLKLLYSQKSQVPLGKKWISIC